MLNKILSLMGFIDEQEIEESYEENPETEENRKRKGQLVALHNNRDNLKVKVIEPNTFDEAQIISDNLKDRRAVVINLENVDIELAKRIVDFVGGTAYAIGGTMQKIGQGIILVVPANIDVDGALKDVNLGDQKEVFSWVSNFQGKETL